MNNQFHFYLIILSIIVSFILYYIIRPRIPILYEALVCTYVTLFCLYLVIQGEYILLIGVVIFTVLSIYYWKKYYTKKSN